MLGDLFHYLVTVNKLKFTFFSNFQTIYQKGDYIVRQGTHGDTFYIISEGQVRVTKRVEGNFPILSNHVNRGREGKSSIMSPMKNRKH